MVDYKKTGKYIQTPTQDSSVYVGKPEQVDYSGKSSRIDDNFTYIASQIGGPEQYHAGTGLTLTASGGDVLNTFNVDPTYVNSLITIVLDDKQDKLTPGAHIDIDENNVISVYGIDQYQAATSEDAGLMSAEDKAKLDDIDEYANNYVLTPATREVLGGIIIGDNLTIDNNGVLDAIDTTYEVAIPSVNGRNGTDGLLSCIDKEKLDSVQPGANRVTENSTNGYIYIDNNAVEVYRHPAYTPRSGIIDSGKLINGITVDDTGHVLGYSTTNEAGMSVSKIGVGNTVIDADYTALSRTITLTKAYLGNIQVGVLDTSTTGTSLEATDSLNTILKKILNNLAVINTNLSADIASKLQYKGNISSIPTHATNGDLYKVAASFIVNGDTVVSGDLLIYNNSSWVKIPSGEKADTWRPVYVDNEQVLTSDFNNGIINFKGTGDTHLIWDAGNNTLNIQTIYSGSGTGNTTYLAGVGLTAEAPVATEDPETHAVSYTVTIDLDIASANTLGGVKVGSGLNINQVTGVLSVDPSVNTWRGITITDNSGAEDIDVILSTTNTDTLKLVPGNNVELETDDSEEGVTKVIINSDDLNTWRPIAIHGTTELTASDNTTLNFTGTAVSYSNGTITINSGGSGGGTSYTFSNGLSVDQSTDPDTVSVNFSGTGSANTVSRSDHTHSYNDLSNKPTISTYINNSSTVEVQSSTGGAGNELAVKISASSGNALYDSGDGLYVPDEPYTNGDATVINDKHIDVQCDGTTIDINDNNQLYVNQAPPATVVTVSTASSTTNLADNTIYKFTHNNITSITLTDTDHVSYCTLIIPKAGTSTTFNKPSGSRCIGYDCSNDNFSPVSGKEYQIAVDNVTGQLTFYVLRMDLDTFVPTT